MSLTVKDNAKDFIPAPAGFHVARCYTRRTSRCELIHLILRRSLNDFELENPRNTVSIPSDFPTQNHLNLS